LTSLICRFPGELVKEPEALQLLVDQLHVVAAPAAPGVPAARAVSSTSSVTEAANMVAAGSTNPGAAGGLFNNLSTPLSFRELKFLLYWSAVPPITSVSYLASPLSRYPLVLQYAMRALECFPVDTTFFYVPQLVQALRHDSDGYVERAILSAAQISQLFAHQIIWNMKANMYSDEESQMPDALKPTLDRIIGEILGGLTGEDRLYYEKEFGFFGKVTGISGKLKPFIKKSKVEKKRKIDEEMRQIRVEPGVYLPSNPEGVVVDIDYDSGRPLQSHAKAPFMATFIVSQPQEATDEVQELLRESERTVTPANRVGDDGSAVTDDCADTDAASATTSYPPTVGEAALQPAPSRPDVAEAMSAQSIPTGDAGDAAGGSSVPPYSQEIDASDLTAKLAGAKIQTCNTFSSGISDAPDLIAISPREQTRSGRPSRDPGRAHSMSRVAEQTDGLRTRRRGASEAPVTPVQLPGVLAAAAGDVGPDGLPVSRLSAIFKVGDDCRQDVLALQLIAAFKNIFASCGLDLYLYPYRVVATAPGCGVIDVVPNSISRDQMGREKVNSLSDYFATRYHGVDSIQYQQARTNFVQSLAAYSVLSYLLQFKDRHNGNIMVDDQGHIVHVDFGFILDIAPGGITFESAPFKLTTEYIQVMGGSPDAQPYRQFCELCIKAYLASRPYADKIIQLVALMLDSGLPCFKGEITLAKLRARFQLDKTERDAAQFMADRISDSYENKRTVLYDQFQKATNGIPY
ncbi:phosphatidylinositol-4- kinase, partial [Coemansia biformis]